MPRAMKPRPVRSQARKVRSEARWSRAVEPVFLRVRRWDNIERLFSKEAEDGSGESQLPVVCDNSVNPATCGPAQ